MMFKEINPKEISDNLIKAIAEEWMLISAGDKDGYNMMTASWGFMGEMWGADSVVAMVRPQRYTMKFINDNDYFTLSFYGDNKAVHKVCGSQSGRDVNKTELTGLTPIFCDNSVYFKEARMVLVCKKQYVDVLKEECFTDTAPLEKWYNKDLHHIIIGKIEKVLIK
ncbi:MAG: flavin reductase [Clostridia bacterium]|nr:flavin reductase [Clostridia bacterium]